MCNEMRLDIIGERTEYKADYWTSHHRAAFVPTTPGRLPL